MSEQTVGRITRKGTWDKRFKRTPQAIRQLPVGPADTRIPPVRLLNLYLAAFALEFSIALWVVSLLMNRGA